MMVSIPLLDIARHLEPAVASLEAEPERLALLLASARRTYTAAGLAVADTVSASWARRARGPYASAIEAVDRAIGRRGAYLLNHSYEWGCTSAAVPDPALGGSTLLRTLDWPFDGLGRALVVTRWDGGAGPYLSATWPGYAGVLTGSAHRRFAAAINQPPLPLPGLGRAVGWSAARAAVWRSTALTPSHLLRLAFDTCASFDDAVRLIRDTPLCLPALFTIAGCRAGEAVVIERTVHDALTPDQPVAANHWASRPGPAGRPRNKSSHARHAAMCDLIAEAPEWSLGWLRPPILQPDTRVAFMANPTSGRVLVQGLEKAGRATHILDVD